MTKQVRPCIMLSMALWISRSVLVDIRHDPGEHDRQMFDWIEYLGLQPIVICTKSDKLKKTQVQTHLDAIRAGLGADEDTIIIPFSGVTKEGLLDIWDFMDQVIENEAE